jgi:hypothetical protein
VVSQFWDRFYVFQEPPTGEFPEVDVPVITVMVHRLDGRSYEIRSPARR